ncbi:MAG: TolC family outer membrane protein [Ahrensia sp.]|nr:TolC family outer membrane protein [Ahrensia sp.]
MRRFCVAIAVSLSMCGSSQADSIKSALAAAYDFNPTLNAQRAATRVADENLALAKSGYRPQIFGTADLGLSRSRVENQVNPPFSSGGTNVTNLVPFGFGVTIQQRLFDGFQTINNVKGAEAGIRASRETLRNEEQNTLFNAATAYADVLRDQGLVNLRRANIRFLREQVRSTNARLEVGEGTRTDVAQSQAQLAQGEALLAASEAALGASQATYVQIIGRRPKGLIWPKGPTYLHPSSLSQAIAVGANQHPAIRATQHLVDVAAFQVKSSEGTFLPTVTLNGSAQQRYNPSSGVNDTTNLQATVNVNIPIYQGGSASATVRQNRETLGQRRIEVDQSRDQVRQAVVSAWTQLQAARANLRANASQVRAANLALEGVIEERNVGQRTQLDVLDAQSVVLDAQELQIQSRRNEVVAGYALVSAIGRLNSRSLNLRVAHYDPKEHYRAVKDRWYGLRTPSGR